MGKVVQTKKKSNQFYTFLVKKHQYVGVNLCIKCTITTVTMHICTVTISCAFIIFIIYSLFFSPCLQVSVTLTSLSLSSFDQIIPLLPQIIKQLLPINHQTMPIADHQIIKQRPLRSSNHTNQIIYAFWVGWVMIWLDWVSGWVGEIWLDWVSG